MSTAAPTFDDIDAKVHNLAQLLDTTVENLMNVNYPASVGDMTRICALLIIARDMSVAMTRDFEAALSACEVRPRNVSAERAAA
ncbi:hypothetical protein [Kaistia adipata]|uniref:hypothetical protein n=1 Tax=Kaistia adipata TaxID=166954 RepID=UPI00040B9EDD|nr:hypothetical protein [Kaistia adipata]